MGHDDETSTIPKPTKRRRGLLGCLALIGIPLLLLLAAHLILVSLGFAYSVQLNLREPSVEIELSKPLPGSVGGGAPTRLRRIPRASAAGSSSAAVRDVEVQLPNGVNFAYVLRVLETYTRGLPGRATYAGSGTPGLLQAECIVDAAGVPRTNQACEATFVAMRSDGKRVLVRYAVDGWRATRSVVAAGDDLGEGSPVGNCDAEALIAKASASGHAPSTGTRLTFDGSRGEWSVPREGSGETPRRFRASDCTPVGEPAQTSAPHPAEPMGPAPVVEPLATEPFPLTLTGADARGRLDLVRVVSAVDSHLRARLSAGKHAGLGSNAFVWLESAEGVLDADGLYDPGQDSRTHVEVRLGAAADGAGPRVFRYIVARRTATFLGGDPTSSRVQMRSAAPRTCSSLTMLRTAREHGLGPSTGSVIASRRTGERLEWLVRAKLGELKPTVVFGADCAFVTVE